MPYSCSFDGSNRGKPGPKVTRLLEGIFKLLLEMNAKFEAASSYLSIGIIKLVKLPFFLLVTSSVWSAMATLSCAGDGAINATLCDFPEYETCVEAYESAIGEPPDGARERIGDPACLETAQDLEQCDSECEGFMSEMRDELQSEGFDSAPCRP